jgi:hypothetical protein
MDELLNTFKSYIDTFRKPYTPHETTNKDVLKLEENINKIKQRRKNANNYSNMETLENIYDNSSIQAEQGSTMPSSYKDEVFVENFQEGARNKGKSKTKSTSSTTTTQSTTKKKKSKGKKGKKKGKKGKKKGKKGKNGFKEKINKFVKILEKFLNKAKKSVFYLRDELDKLVSYVAVVYVYFISIVTNPDLADLKFDFSNVKKMDFDNIQADKEAFKIAIYKVISMPLLLYATYNWFYLMVYMKAKEEEDGMLERPFDDDKRMKISLDGIKPDFIKKPLQFSLNYAITPLYWFDKLFNNNIYTYFANNIIGWKILNYLLIFIFVFIINTKFGLFDSLDHFIKNKPSFLYKFCGIIIAGTLLYNIFNHIFNPSQEIKTLRVFKYLFGILLGFIYIILTTFVAGMSINISAILILMYVWIHSLFGIFLYNKKGIFGYFEEKKNMDNYIKRDSERLQTEDCEKLSFFERILLQIVKFLNDNRKQICKQIINLSNLFIKYKSSYVQNITAFLSLLTFFIMSFFEPFKF